MMKVFKRIINAKRNQISWFRATVVAMVFGILLCGTAIGIPVVYSGGDEGAGPGDPWPNSNATAAAFDTAAGSLGPLNIIDFEGLPTGNFTTLTVAPGVTATLSGTDDGGGILTDNSVILGYNVTAGGMKHLRVVPISDVGTASVYFAFDVPIQAFGAYLTGVGTANGNLHLVFDNGDQQDLPIPGYTEGGVQFYGFTSAGSSIVSVTMEMRDVSGSRDIFGVDDVRHVVVPEPATVALLGLGSLFLIRRRRKVVWD